MIDIKIYYQDTGSIHVTYHIVDKNENRYKEKYGSELVGEELGNFHIDFSMGNASSETHAIESLSLGKETYIDFLESTGEDGKAINPEHIRMKGIRAACIRYYAEQHNTTVLDVYTKLFNYKTIKFDLTNGGNKFVCRNIKYYTISNVSDFVRKCQYIRDESKIIFIN